MGSLGRGRRSAADLENPVTLDAVGRRPDPPSELAGEEVQEWQVIVQRMPVGWFTRESFPLLVQYCRHVVQARTIAKMIRDARKNDTINYERLLRMQERETKSLATLATKMKIAQTSTIDAGGHKNAKVLSATDKPWAADEAAA